MNTIAVIEDDLPIGNLLEEVLTKAGYIVRRAYSGTEALYLFQRKSPTWPCWISCSPDSPGRRCCPISPACR